MVRVHFIIEMTWWTGLVPWEFELPFQVALYQRVANGGGVACDALAVDGDRDDCLAVVLEGFVK